MNLPEKYESMLQKVSAQYPMIEKATRNFNKTQSQFMDFTMTVSQPTELRSVRQILAEINKSKMALDEAFFKVKKKQIRIEQKKARIRSVSGLEQDMLEVEIAELESQIGHTMGYVEGAIRRVSAYMSQYQQILDFLGKSEFTEADFEADEERYHIMKAFEQALCAARARGGAIDEGNHIYFYQIGINGGQAQSEVLKHLESEGKALVSGASLPHSYEWLCEMAAKYAGSACKFVSKKHMALSFPNAFHEAIK